MAEIVMPEIKVTISGIKGEAVGRFAALAGKPVEQLIHTWIATQPLSKLVLDPQQLVDLITHVDRYPDGASLVGNGARNGLPDPPGGICAELVTLVCVKLLRSPDEPDIPLLY